MVIILNGMHNLLKKQTNKYKEHFETLKPMGIMVLENKETRVATCIVQSGRNSSGYFLPHNQVMSG